MAIRTLPRTPGSRPNVINLVCDGVDGAENAYVSLAGMQTGFSGPKRIRIDSHLGTIAIASTVADDVVATNPDPVIQGSIAWNTNGNAIVGTPLVLQNGAMTALRIGFPAGAPTQVSISAM